MKDIVVDGADALGGNISLGVLAVGFVAAFLAGCAACKWMINIVRRGKLIWFAAYCAVVGLAVLIFS